MPKYRTDYLGIHQAKYQRIAEGELAGWSDEANTAHAVAQVKRALGLPGMPAEGRLLELGCGDGCLSVRFAQALPFAVSGIDIVPLALELAGRRAAEAGAALDLALGDVRALPWPAASFDVVVDGNLLHCIVQDDRARCLAEVRRVLKPGGLFVVMCMAGDPPAGALDQAVFDPEARCMVRDGVAGRHFATPESLLSELTAAGFAVRDSWINPATHDQECDELVAAAVRG